MFFKTFDSDKDNIISKIGLFNKSFATMQRDYKKGNSLAVSVFSGNNITQNDIKSIQAMNEAMKNGESYARAWTDHMQGATTAAKQQVAQCLKNKGSLSELTTSLQKTTTATKLLTTATQAFSMIGNMIVFTLISKGIELAATAISNYINRMEIAQEKTEEAINTYESITVEVDSLSTSIEELQKQISELDPITNADDIKNLEIEKGLLESELAILKEKQAIAKQESHDAAVDSLNTTTTSKYVAPTTTTQFIAGETVTTTTFTETTQQQELEYAMQAYRDYEKQIEELNTKQKELKDSGKENSSEYRKNAETIKNLGTQMKDARSHANELAIGLQNQAKGLDTTTIEGEQLSNSINGTLDDYVSFTDSLETNTDALNENSDAKDENANKTENLSFEEQLAGVESLSKGLDQLADIYKDVQDGGDFDWSSILNNEDFKNTFKDCGEVYDEFIKTISNSPDDIGACQEAFDKLATAYIYGSEKLQGVTRETQSATVAFLEQKGITNALAIVEKQLTINEEALAIAKEKNIVASGNLTDATVDELTVLAQEATVSETTANYLDYLLLSKLDLNDYKLNTESDVNQIIAIAEAAGVSAEQVVALQKVLEIFSDFSPNFKPVDISGYDEETLSRAPREWVENQYKYAEAMKEAQAIIDDAAQSKFDLSDFYTNINSPSSTSTNKTEKEFDHIETKISRIQRAITNFGKTVKATYLSWSTRNNALLSELAEVNKEIVTQKQAYETYLSKANSVALDETTKSKIRNGDISIQELSGDKAGLADEYKNYYEKYLEAYDAYLDGTATLAEKAREQFNLASSEYDSKIDSITSRADILNAYIDQVEARGNIVSKSYYEELKRVENDNISALQGKYNQLSSLLKQAVDTDRIKVGSEEYNNMKSEIDDVQQALIEANTALIEYDNSIHDLNWEIFDKLQDKISEITEETDFLLELLSNEKMFDGGKITEHGQAAMGLHVVNYETFKNQAEQYASEIAKLDEEFANNKSNEYYLERRAELLDSHREMILASQDELNALIELKQEGYDSMLDSLDDAIEKYNELHDAERSLYDYEKTVSEQVAEVDKYQKIIDSLQGMKDTEQGKSMLQKYEVSLQEAKENLEQTQMDKNIEEREKLLTSIRDEAEQWVSERLDQEDEILREVMADTNSNIDSIRETLEKETNDVGTALSTEMDKILGGQGIGSVVTIENTISSTLTDIKTLIQSMVNDSNATASSDIGSTTSPTPTVTPSTPTTPSTPSTTDTASGSSESGNWGSWFISKRDSYPKDKLRTNSSIVDRLKFHNFDSSQSARASYYVAMGGSGRYTGSSSQNRWMIEQMKANGYRHGGTIGSLIKSSGEDGFVLARTGEEILSLDKIKELGFTFEKMYPFIDYMKNIPTITNTNSSVTNSPNITVDMSGMQVVTNDPDQFAKQVAHSMQNYKFVKQIMNDETLGTALGHNTLMSRTRR